MSPPTFKDMIFQFSLNNEQATAPQKNRRHEMNLKFKELELALTNGKSSRKMTRKDILNQAEDTLHELKREREDCKQENEQILHEIAMAELELMKRKEHEYHMPNCPISADQMISVPNLYRFPDSGSSSPELAVTPNKTFDSTILINEELERVIHAIDAHGVPETLDTPYPSIFPIPYPSDDFSAESYPVNQASSKRTYKLD